MSRKGQRRHQVMRRGDNRFALSAPGWATGHVGPREAAPAFPVIPQAVIEALLRPLKP